MRKVEGLIEKRYSNRKYSSKFVDKKKNYKDFQTSSACNDQPWRFVAIENTNENIFF